VKEGGGKRLSNIFLPKYIFFWVPSSSGEIEKKYKYFQSLYLGNVNTEPNETNRYFFFPDSFVN